MMSAPRFAEDGLAREVWPRFSRMMRRGGFALRTIPLGRPADRMGDDVHGALDGWYRDMDDAWDYWLDGRECFEGLVSMAIYSDPVAANKIDPPVIVS